jgi:hypothetical protein
MAELCLRSWTNLILIHDSTYTPRQWHRQPFEGLLRLDYWGDHPIIISQVTIWYNKTDQEYQLQLDEKIILQKSQENLVFCTFGTQLTYRVPCAVWSAGGLSTPLHES